MATTSHSGLTGANLHEPKGVASATDGQIAHASSSAVNWEFQFFTVNVTIPAFGTAKDLYVVSPYAGTLQKCMVTTQEATGGADETFSFTIGGAAVTNGNITIATSGAAAGDVGTSSPTGNNSVAANATIKCTTAGDSNNTGDAHVTLLIKRTS